MMLEGISIMGADDAAKDFGRLQGAWKWYPRSGTVTGEHRSGRPKRCAVQKYLQPHWVVPNWLHLCAINTAAAVWMTNARGSPFLVLHFRHKILFAFLSGNCVSKSPISLKIYDFDRLVLVRK
jgi:hypothetical protein